MSIRRFPTTRRSICWSSPTPISSGRFRGPTSSGPTAACGRSTTTAAADPSAVTRDYVLKVDALDGAPGPERAPVLSIFGGKITTYRKLAEHALAELAPYFPRMKPAWTRNAPLPGGDLPGRDRNAWLAELVPPLSAIAGAAAARARRSPRHARVAHPGRCAIARRSGRGFRRAAHRARNRLSGRARSGRRTADDVLWRRTKCGLPMTQAQRDAVAEYMATRL